MGFARVGSNPTVVDNFLRIVVLEFQVRPCGAMDSASDFGSGGWGFESPQGLCMQPFFFFFVCSWFGPQFLTVSMVGKFGRVVKALALGASLARGMGSNTIACTLLFVSVTSVMGV